jgi:hypothetical protein
MNRPARATAVVVAFAAVVGVVVGMALYLIGYPPTVAAASTSSGEESITLQTVPAINSGDHPTWVSYMVLQGSQWVHSTALQVHANSVVHFTIYQFDTGSPLRNSFMDQVQGTVGGIEILNGTPVHLINDFSDNGIGHSFAIPSLAVSVPLPGVSADAKNPCSTPAPCPMSSDHNTVQFTIRTGAAGTYQWQCFVPCALGFPLGNGGPMSTFGYMSGYLKVVA